jgi:outer membrane protein assembly factor BamB
MKTYYLALFIILLTITGKQVTAQQTTANKLASPKILPGKGAAEFDFFYAGEAKALNMYIVRNGKITWSYIDTVSKGEISDAVLMTNGNILFAHQFGITLIDKNKKVLWHYDTPKNHETHTAQPIGKDNIVFIQNGDTAKLFVVNIKTNKIVKQFALPVKYPKSVHGQFRHARLTPAGSILVAHMDMGMIKEYDSNGTELLSLDMPGVWSAEPLKNDHILAAGHVGTKYCYVKEIDRKGNVLWEYTLNDMPDYKFLSPQIATRLANGNTMVNNWFNLWDGKVDPQNPEVQAIILTPDKKVIWALREWAKPLNLGPATTIQLLNDSNSLSERVRFGDIK